MKHNLTEEEKRIAKIIEQVVEDARGKWASHQEESDGVLEYVTEILQVRSEWIPTIESVAPTIKLKK